LWDKYQAAYQDLIHHTSAKHAPWMVVPADHKWFARVVISSAIVSRNGKTRFALSGSRQERCRCVEEGEEALVKEEQEEARSSKAKKASKS
jgi:hypothetical protein